MNKPFLILLVCVFLLGTNGLIIAPMITDVARDLAVSIPVAARAIAAFGAGTALFSLAFGRSLDHFGLVRALYIALGIGGLAQLGTALSSNAIAFSGFQFAAGAASGIGLPAIYAITKLLSERGQESRRMGQVLTGWSLGLIFAVPIGARVAYAFDWHAVFYTVAMAHGLAILLTFLLPTIPEPENRIKSGRFVPLTKMGAPAAYAICFLFMASFYGTYALTGAYTVEGLHQNIANAGWVALVYGLGFGTGAFGAPHLDRYRPALTQIYTLTTGAVVLLAMGVAPNFAVFLVAVFLWGLINHMNLNLILRRISDLVPDAPGAALGLYSALTYAGASAGAYVFSLVYSNFGFLELALMASTFHLIGSALAAYSAAREARLRS